MLRDRVINSLVTIVQRHAQLVLGHVGKRHVDCQCGENQRVPDLVIRAIPLVLQFPVLGRIDVKAAGPQGKVVLQDPLDLVGSPQHGQPSQFTGTVAHGSPAGKVVEASLEVDKILVDRSGVVGVLGEP